MPGSDRLARPGGNSASVVILEESASFHHSSNDPLCDGHSHSAFDVFCVLEQGGDFKAALQAAAGELGLELGPSAEEKRGARRLEVEALANANGLPAIEIRNRQLPAILDDLAGAIGAFNHKSPRLFHGAQGMLEIALDTKGNTVMQPVLRARLQVIAGRAAFWFRT